MRTLSRNCPGHPGFFTVVPERSWMTSCPRILSFLAICPTNSAVLSTLSRNSIVISHTPCIASAQCGFVSVASGPGIVSPASPSSNERGWLARLVPEIFQVSTEAANATCTSPQSHSLSQCSIPSRSSFVHLGNWVKGER